MSRPPNPRSSNVSGVSPHQIPPVYPTGSFAGAPPGAPPPGYGSGLIPPPGGYMVGGPMPPPPPGLNAAHSSLSIPPPHSRPHSRVEPPPLSSTMGPMPGTLERPIQGPRKRLIVTCDGTWLDSDNGLMNGRLQPPSNVSRIGWAIKDTSRDGIPQIVNYQAGVGTTGTRVSRAVSGATGLGLKENVREAYTYLAINWREGDEIFLVGFSRGAFTARSVAGMIGSLGLLSRQGIKHFNEIFEDWEHRGDDRYVSRFEDVPYEKKGPFDDRYVSELERRGLTRRRVPIKVVAVWDTVGSLGVPRLGVLEAFGAKSSAPREYEFYDTRLHECIENAFQALALDEHRRPFSPAVWEKRDNERTHLEQVWFPGVHSNIGGGYEDADIANISLAWMMSRLERFLDFRTDFLVGLNEENRRYYRDTGQKPRWWSFGEIYNSAKGVYALAGSKTRTPGEYYRVDGLTGKETTKRLRVTNEFIHASVRARMGLRGPGPMDRGTYDPPALRDWTYETEFVGRERGGNDQGLIVMWTDRSGRDGGLGMLPEATLMASELALLDASDKRVVEFVRNLHPPTPVKEKRRSKRMSGMPQGVPPGMNPGSVAGPIPGAMPGAMPGPDARGSGRVNGNMDVDDDRTRRRERRTRDPDKERRRRSRRYDDD